MELLKPLSHYGFSIDCRRLCLRALEENQLGGGNRDRRLPGYTVVGFQFTGEQTALRRRYHRTFSGYPTNFRRGRIAHPALMTGCKSSSGILICARLNEIPAIAA
jgi:hypothetical protein